MIEHDFSTTSFCRFCKTSRATKLCDMPIGRSRYCGHPPRHLMEKAKNINYAFVSISMEKVITCDKEMCDKCATNVCSDIDFCPDCVMKIKIAANKKG